MKNYLYLLSFLPLFAFSQPFLPADQMPVDESMNHAVAPQGVPGQKEFALWQDLATYDLKKKVVTKELKNKIGKEVTIAGFVIPLDFEAQKISEFLLVPYVPSCAHVPPPSENQIIQVKLLKGKKIEPGMLPMKIKGTLTLSKPKKVKNEDSFLPDAVFEISATEIEEF